MKLIAYGKTNWEKDFPSALEDQVEAKKYISAFHSALNPVLRELVDRDEHIMRACSLLSIPPPGTLVETSGDPHGSHCHEAARQGK